jgi:hypothetical protein
VLKLEKSTAKGALPAISSGLPRAVGTGTTVIVMSSNPTQPFASVAVIVYVVVSVGETDGVDPTRTLPQVIVNVPVPPDPLAVNVVL